MKLETSLARGVRLAVGVAAAASALLLSGCYVVPIQHAGQLPPPSNAVVLAPPLPMTFSARLYPANEAAAAYGMISAVVTNDLHGRGVFSTNIGGENFSGEATRLANSNRDGVANGAGNRGGFINCRYTMNSPSLGTGSCRLSNGAQFTMHIGG